MKPRYASGAHVVIDFEEVARVGLVPGECYFVQLRGEGNGKNTFKRFVGIEGGKYVFDCVNKKYGRKLRLDPGFNAGVARGTVNK